jgi:ABC-type transporter Mla subunit MlaD
MTAMTTEKAADISISARLEHISRALSELRGQLELQASHAQGLNTVIDARSDQLHGALDQLRVQFHNVGATTELSGRLDNVSNISVMVSDLVGGGLAQRLEILQHLTSSLGEQLKVQTGQAENLHASLDTQLTEMRGAMDQLRKQGQGTGAIAELSGKLDNISNALLNVGVMVSGLVGDGMASRLELVEKMQEEIRTKLEGLSQALSATNAHIDNELTRYDVSARLYRIERALGEPG